MTQHANDKALKTRKGMAIKGLKAWIKALELAEGARVSQQRYRYEIADNGLTARIYTSDDNSTVEGTERPLEDWANVGRPARLALIGLRHQKDQMERAGDRVQYTMNIVSGEAYLARNGARLEDHPVTVEGWAEFARPIEKAQFESLRVAQDWGNKDAEESVMADMIRWGIIRPHKSAQSESQAS